ncbi:MAG: T9SS type A sorting domain-containing protein [Saprospiraceae bacterium]|nr:T9SS type A sorting domain-containing protein [Saprospiraceae bacterium]
MGIHSLSYSIAMVRYLFAIIYTVFSISLGFKLNAQDTITVQTFTWDSVSRNAWFSFPDIPTSEIERINLIYNMRCHDAAVGVGSIGCREWDYSCNTFITDTTRFDSVLANQKKYIIPNYTESDFYYSNSATYNCAQYVQKNASYSSLSNAINATIGIKNSDISFKDKDGRYFYLFKAVDLINGGLKPGKMLALKWNASKPGTLSFLKINLKNTNDDELDPTNADFNSATEVYFKNTDFIAGSNTLIFHKEFNWDGVSNIQLELSFNLNKNNSTPEIEAFNAQNLAIGSIEDTWSVAQTGMFGLNLPPQKMSSVADEISISFWANGDRNTLPVNTSFLEAVDKQNNRQINIHLPWSNSSIYWDCGYSGGSYDRIEKASSSSEFSGQWTNWTFTKNARTGIMNIYKNGSLWHTGTGKTKPISVDRMNLLSNIDNQLSYYGRVSHLSIWNKEIDSSTIQDWILDPGNTNHPYYNSLLYYYPMNQNSNQTITDVAPNPATIQNSDFINWYKETGRNRISGYSSISELPVTTFVQGTLIGYKVEDINAVEEIPMMKIPVTEFEIEKGAPKIVNRYIVYPGGDLLVKDESGMIVDFKTTNYDGIFTQKDIRYQRFSPAKFELLSLVTPYGNNLDLGKEGKTFVFDVSDYAPILRNSKRLSIENGGENQEELDIKFQFIKGKPAREVKEIQNIYAFQLAWFPDIISSKVMEQRNLVLDNRANSFKIRSTITGHEQNGEFTSRSHFFNVIGSKSSQKFDFTVWKECADNPIYPQGGTWIFDRAGWCPGAASDVHEFQIGHLGDPGTAIKIDYGLNGANLDAAKYLISSQLVSYGPSAYSLDAGIESIVRPNSERVEFERFNPSCSKPMVQIKNFGATDISTIDFSYYTNSGTTYTYSYSGNIKPLEIKNIELPIQNMEIWSKSTDSLFTVKIDKVNQKEDDNPRNNLALSKFKFVRIFDFDPVFELRTNNVARDNSFRIKDMNGQVIIEKNNLPAVTTTQENLMLPDGCYTLEVIDASDDGLSFWFYPNLGNGSVAFKKRINTALATIQSFKADFGKGFQFDFVIRKTTDASDIEIPLLLSVSPNPAHAYVDLKISSNKLNQASIELLNATGNLVFHKKVSNQNSDFNETISLENLRPGLYLLKIKSGAQEYIKKLIVE